MKVYGLNRKIFSTLVEEVLSKTHLSYREAEELLGVSYSTFTRIKKLKSIHIDSFIIILNWLNSNFEIGFNELIRQMLLQK